jgi:hypothetical protein
MRDKKATCRCGTRADEWDDDRTEDPYVPASWECPGCAQIAQHEANGLRKDYEGKTLPGQYTYLEPIGSFRARMDAKQHQP